MASGLVVVQMPYWQSYAYLYGHNSMTVELSGHYGYRRIVRTMLPMVAMMLVTSIYSIVDGFFISNFAGSTPFAAMNIIWPGLAILTAVGLMIGSGGSALVSKLLGEGRTGKACETFTMLTRVSLIAGIVMAAAVIVFMEPICIALGAEGEMVPYAVTYGRIVSLSLPLYLIQMEYQSFYMTAERPQLGTAMSIICGITNIALDAVLVVWLDRGLAGAAVATSISLAIGGIFPLAFFSSRRNTTHLKYVAVGGIDWKSLGKACSNGLSEYVGNIAFNLIAICYNLQLMKFIGENGVTAYGIIMYVGFIFGAVFIGYNMGISQVIAYNYGAENKQELRSLLCKSLVLIALDGAFLTLISELAAPWLARTFVGYDEVLTALTIRATRIYMLSFLLCGFNMFTSAWFTALNNGTVSAVAAFTRTLVFELAAVFILPVIMGVEGIWWAVCVAEALAFILTIILILSFRRRYGY